MRRNRPLIAVTSPPQNQNWAGGGPAPYQGFQSPRPHNPPVGGYNESSSYPPNYAPPAYGKDAPGGFQPYPPVSIYLSSDRFVQVGLMFYNSLLVLPL